MLHPPLYIGTASWTIPATSALRFPEAGSHLVRYSQRLRGVELNSSFYRAHRPATYERWAASVPKDFRFAVKVPKAITHTRQFEHPAALLEPFLEACAGLGTKLGPLLVQLPPQRAFTCVTAHSFFATLRARFAGDVVCEARHASWFTVEVEGILSDYQIARVAADPAIVPQASRPGGWTGLCYYRLHGSPQRYTSAYSQAFLDTLARTLATPMDATALWCIFDNTAAGAATADALSLMQQVARLSVP